MTTDDQITRACGLLQGLCEEPIDPTQPVETIDSLTVLEWVFVLEEEFERTIDEGVVETILPSTPIAEAAGRFLA